MRKTGRTTRLADECIQELFKRNEVSVIDHYGTQKSSFYLLGIILDRLENEHPETFRNLEVDTPVKTHIDNMYKIRIKKILDQYYDGYKTEDFNDLAYDLNDLFALGVVSQQRELLLAYEFYNASEDDKKNNKKYLEKLVDDFLANNCG